MIQDVCAESLILVPDFFLPGFRDQKSTRPCIRIRNTASCETLLPAPVSLSALLLMPSEVLNIFCRIAFEGRRNKTNVLAGPVGGGIC